MQSIQHNPQKAVNFSFIFSSQRVMLIQCKYLIHTSEVTLFLINDEGKIQDPIGSFKIGSLYIGVVYQEF
jgi:hypothetical protein